MIRRTAQQGYLMIVAVLIIVIIGFLGVGVAYLFNSNSRSSLDHLLSNQAFYIAESGLEVAAYNLLDPTVSGRDACTAAGTTNIIVGQGRYTVTGSGPSYVASATLNGALSASATTIPVNSTTGYDSGGGRIMIDRELINYTSISGNNFIGAIRGVDGTTAITHITGTPVGQYQCDLAAQGGVSTLTAPTNPGSPYGRRELRESMQLQEGWAVGNDYTGITWNIQTENQWVAVNNDSSSPNINAISMLSYSNIWVVGDSALVAHSNNNSVTVFSVSPNVNYYGIYCNSINNCIAVGEDNGNRATILYWDGASWTRASTLANIDTTLRSVYCTSASNCWAVGTNQGSERYFFRGGNASWSAIAISSSVTGFTFNSVFCANANDCWAVGSNANFARNTSGGNTWTNFPTGLPSTTYTSIYCNSTTDCWAVGNANSSQDLFVHWNGTAWSRDGSNPTPTANLKSVACVNSNDCWAVGSRTSSSSTPVFVHWNGGSWSQFTPSGTMPSDQLNALALIGARTQPQSAWRETFP